MIYDTIHSIRKKFSVSYDFDQFAYEKKHISTIHFSDVYDDAALEAGYFYMILF